MPSTCGERSSAIVTPTTLAEVIALPEQIAIIGVIQGTGLEQRGCPRSAGSNVDVEHDRVLIHASATPIGLDAVIHDVTDLTFEISGDFHDRS